MLEVKNVSDGLLLCIRMALLPLRIRHNFATGQMRVVLASALETIKEIVDVAIRTTTKNGKLVILGT